MSMTVGVVERVKIVNMLSRSGRGSEWVVIRVVFIYMNNISSVYNFDIVHC